MKTNHPSLIHPKYRADIDGLRAIAVLSVVFYHAFPNWLHGGFVGVDIFFVISGYLISTIIFDSLEKNVFSFREFYARRIKRIFPALLLTIVFCCATSWFVLLPDEYKQFGKHAASGAGFVSNLAFWQEAGYFDNAAAAKPLLHLWSLGIEEQFYIVWPLISCAIWNLRRGVVAVSLFIALCSFFLNAALIHNHPNAAFYSPFTRFWELLLGGLVAHAIRHRKSRLNSGDATEPTVPAHPIIAAIQSLLGIFLITMTIFFLDASKRFPGFWALLPTLGTCLVIVAGPDAWPNRKLLSQKFLVWFGLISFPLYLWHWPLLSFALIIGGVRPTPMERGEAVLAAILLAWGSYRYIENPLRHSRNKATTIVLCSLLSLVFLFGIAAYNGTIPGRIKTTGIEQILAAAQDWQFPPPNFRRYWWENQRFFIGNAGSDQTVLFIGDSNMEMYAPRIGKLLDDAPSKYKTAIFATKGGCRPIPSQYEIIDDCRETMESAFRLAHQKQINSVVIAAHWLHIPPEQRNDELYASLATMLDALTKEKKVFLILNIPSGPMFDPKEMFSGSRLGKIVATKIPKTLNQNEFLSDYAPLRDKLIEVAQKYGVTVIDPMDSLCANGVCPVTTSLGVPLYRDTHHFRYSYAKMQAKYIDETLERDTITGDP